MTFSHASSSGPRPAFLLHEAVHEITEDRLGCGIDPESVAVHVTDVVPSGNVLPDCGLQEMDGEGSSLSVAVTEKATTAPPGPVASTVCELGTVSVAYTMTTPITFGIMWRKMMRRFRKPSARAASMNSCFRNACT